MKISEIGGEFALISRVTAGIPLPDNVIKGIGDDCAVIRKDDGVNLLVTTDMMVQNDHFSLSWMSPEEVGSKLMESNVSDIHAMGGRCTFAFLSMSLTRDTEVEFMDSFYRGLLESARRHGVTLLGGDTTHGTELVFNLALLGESPSERTIYRHGARPGDLICVTGHLGGSTAGLKAFLRNREGGERSRHTRPRARLHHEAAAIAQYATAMIDVSDGLASEVRHICTASGTGGIIRHESIPISAVTLELARIADEDAADCALYGGEDFELVFTIAQQHIDLLRDTFYDFSIVGEITESKYGVQLLRNGTPEKVKSGYNHFA